MTDWRAAPTREEGFTLLELVIALTVLAVAIFGISSVFAASSRTGAVELHRSAAVALASKADEHLRTVPYDQLGMPAAGCDSGTTVVVPSSTIAASDPPVTISGIAYTVGRCIDWSADSATPTPVSSQAYKHTIVTVQWTDEAGSHTVRQDSDVYPGGLGPATSTSTTSTTVPSCNPPPNPAFSFAASVVAANSVRLSWFTPSSPPSPIVRWVVEYLYSGDGFATTNVFTDALPAASPGSLNQVTLSGLAANTDYSFEVVAVSSCGQLSQPSSQVSAHIDSWGPAGCRVGLVTVTPTVVQRDLTSAQVSAQSISVVVATDGSCVSPAIQYSPTAGSSVTVGLTTNDGNTWTAQLPSLSEAWDLGPHTLTITGAPAPASTSVCVVNAGVTSC